MSTTPGPKSAGWPKAQLVYYVLATLNVITIAGGLLLSHQIIGVFETAVATSGTYERQLASVRNLTDATTDAQSISIDGLQAGNMETLISAFLTKTGDARVEMDRIRNCAAESFSPPAQEQIKRILARLEKSLDSLEQHALAAFEQRPSGNGKAALAELKKMQQRHFTLHPDIRGINQLSALQRNGSLEEFRRNIGQLRKYEYAIGGLIGVVLFKGHFISTLMRREYAELQVAFEASAKAESEAGPISIQL